MRDGSYTGGQHSNYRALSDQPLETGAAICKAECDGDARCHAVDMDYPFAGDCWMFEDSDG